MMSLPTEILCVGYELLSGTMVNSNAHWISQKIYEIGGFVKRITVIGDDLSEIAQTVTEAIARRPNWLILSGGLGPTYDDKTLEGVATSLDLELTLNEDAVSMLKKRYAFQSKNSELNEIRVKMARIPFGSKPLRNPVGSAPAVLIQKYWTKIVCLPGVPKEMKAIFSGSIIPLMKKEVGEFWIIESNYEVMGVSEAMIAPKISQVAESSPLGVLYVKTHPLDDVTIEDNKQTRLRIQIMVKGRNEAEAETMACTVSNTITKEISRFRGMISRRSEKKFHN